MLVAGSFKGTGIVTVNHEDGTSTVQEDHNLVLDTFFAWLVSQNNIKALTPTVKVGIGASPSVATMGALESAMALNSGTWPVTATPVAPVSSVVNGDTVVARITFNFTFAKGQVNGNLAEYGLDFTGATAGSNSAVHTRVTTKDENGDQAAITVKLTDQLTIGYIFEYQAPLNVPDKVVTVDYGGGNTVDHTFKFVWSDYRPLVAYMNLCGSYGTGSSAPAFIACSPSSLAGNFETQYGASGGAGPTVVTRLEADAVALDYKFGSAQGNQAAGVNLIQSNGSNLWYRWTVSPPLPKVAGTELSFTIRRPMRG